MKFCLGLAVVLMTVSRGCGDVEYEDALYRDAVQFIDECGSKSLSICLKEKALKYIERLPSNLDIGGGIRIKQSEAGRLSRQHASISLPREETAREQVLNQVLLERIADYLTSHTFEFKLSPGAITDIERSMDEGRKKKDKKGMMPLLLLFKLKAITLGAIAIKLIGFVAFKALLIAKVALTIASVIALKKVLEQKHHTSTYEVFAHPHLEDYSHLDRSFIPNLPYKGHNSS